MVKFSNSKCFLGWVTSNSLVLRFLATLQNCKFYEILRFRHPEGFSPKNLLGCAQNDVVRKRVAFTLAEVLITLGIIGIVAAMTLPTLINKISDRVTINRLRQTYSLFSNALELAQKEYGEISLWGSSETIYDHDELYFRRITQFLKLAQDCGRASLLTVCGNTGWYSSYNNLSVRKSYPGPNHGRAGILPNGVRFYIYADNMNNNKNWGVYATIGVDVNGKTLPNSLGKDAFVFSIGDQSNAWSHNKKAVLYPSGQYYDRTKSYCLEGNTATACTYWALKHNNLDYLYCREKLGVNGPFSCAQAKKQQ
ncbi:MAG: type II secretion system protein [Cyanobacteria bacterium SIG26]|nr:type II secretion system protein [Cyanobacteria bacterium SIG26]